MLPGFNFDFLSNIRSPFLARGGGEAQASPPPAPAPEPTFTERNRARAIAGPTLPQSHTPIKVPTAATSGSGFSASPPSTPAPAGPAAPDGGAVRGEIESGFDEVNRLLDSKLGIAEGQADADRAQVDELFGTQQVGIEGSRDAGIRNIDEERTNVKSQKGETLKDLDERLRNLIQSTQVFLGARGAGDSSAAGRASAAITKAGLKGSSEIMREANSMWNNLTKRELDIKDEFETQMTNLRQWKSDRLADISSFVRNVQQQIADQKATASAAKAQALANLETNLMNQAFASLQQIDNQMATWQSQVQQWALNSSNNVNQVKARIQELSNVQFQGFVPPTLPGIRTGGNQIQASTPGRNVFGAEEDQLSSRF